MRKKLVLVATTIAMTFSVGNSIGASMSYTDEATWNSAVTNAVTDNYESYGWTGFYGDLLSSNVTLGTITYSFPQFINGIGPNLTIDAPYLSGSYLEWQPSPNPLTINFNQAITAFSFDFGEFGGNSGLDLSVTLGNGDAFTASNVANAYSFFGVTSDTAFSTITLNSNINSAVMDNLTYADAGNPVPEPTTMLLFGTGIAGLAVIGRRRK